MLHYFNSITLFIKVFSEILLKAFALHNDFFFLPPISWPILITSSQGRVKNYNYLQNAYVSLGSSFTDFQGMQ